ncbi:hypothetical protein QBC35DRAFT_476336 [Podospora australis]|uniref:Uncharacterized protein n=1 Tax=Podospora australis TaxID=1536484 RepID=A0AAN7AGV7_9PEZI|nr:hypothetical protein QBC35DRAFT_476336 [Podospora australis]
MDTYTKTWFDELCLFIERDNARRGRRTLVDRESEDSLTPEEFRAQILGQINSWNYHPNQPQPDGQGGNSQGSISWADLPVEERIPGTYGRTPVGRNSSHSLRYRFEVDDDEEPLVVHHMDITCSFCPAGQCRNPDLHSVYVSASSEGQDTPFNFILGFRAVTNFVRTAWISPLNLASTGWTNPVDPSWAQAIAEGNDPAVFRLILLGRHLEFLYKVMKNFGTQFHKSVSGTGLVQFNSQLDDVLELFDGPQDQDEDPEWYEWKKAVRYFRYWGSALAKDLQENLLPKGNQFKEYLEYVRNDLEELLQYAQTQPGQLPDNVCAGRIEGLQQLVAASCDDLDTFLATKVDRLAQSISTAIDVMETRYGEGYPATAGAAVELEHFATGQLAQLRADADTETFRYYNRTNWKLRHEYAVLGAN